MGQTGADVHVCVRGNWSTLKKPSVQPGDHITISLFFRVFWHQCRIWSKPLEHLLKHMGQT